MKITFVAPTLNFNGGLRVIGIYADYLSRFGHEVTVISPGKRTPTFKQKIKRIIKRQSLDIDTNFSTGYFDSMDINLKILKSYRPVEERDVPDADIIIATWWETAHWVNKFSDKKGKKVYFMQDYGCVPGQPLEKIQDTWMLPFHIITISQWLMSLIKQHGMQNRNVSLVTNGVDLSVFETPIREKGPHPTVGFLYNNAPQKGAKLMISAFLKAKVTIPNLRLVMFGSPEFPVELEETQDVVYYRKASDEKIVEVYASCDVWLFGSDREGFGLPLLEAMACRTPVIATDAGAASELMAESGGQLVAINDIDAMCDAIIRIIRMSQDEWQCKSEQAYQVAVQHSWDSCAKKFQDLLLREAI